MTTVGFPILVSGPWYPWMNSIFQQCSGSEPTKVKCNYVYPKFNYVCKINFDPLSLKGANVITLKCNYIWPISLTKCNYIYQILTHVTLTMVVDISLLRWCSNEWFQPIRISDTYFNWAKCNGNVISVSEFKYFTSLHFHYIAPLPFKCNYICHNLSEFTARWGIKISRCWYVTHSICWISSTNMFFIHQEWQGGLMIRVWEI